MAYQLKEVTLRTDNSPDGMDTDLRYFNSDKMPDIASI